MIVALAVEGSGLVVSRLQGNVPNERETRERRTREYREQESCSGMLVPLDERMMPIKNPRDKSDVRKHVGSVSSYVVVVVGTSRDITVGRVQYKSAVKRVPEEQQVDAIRIWQSKSATLLRTRWRA